MKALNLTATSTFELIEVEVPMIGSDEVLVEVKATGICGSDVHGIDGSSGRRIPPVIMGHESAGVIAKVGEAVADWNVGQRVTFDSTIYCNQCPFCVSGRVNLCDQRRVLGVSCGEYNQPGAFAQFISVPARILYEIPETMSFAEAAFCEPVAVALHAVKRVGVQPGNSAVVIGAGIIGLLIVQALKDAGCQHVIAVDLDPFKLEMAKQLGADTVIMGGEGAEERVLHSTQGNGVHVAMEVVGISATVDLAVNVLAKGGSLGCVGNISPAVEFPWQKMVTRELTVYGSCAIQNEYPLAIEKIDSGAIQVQPMISMIVPLSDGADWFARLHRNDENLLKVILEP
ncbi:MAG: galactitol-1-phosphate 5-dehydrogenase [Planctomycetota bacterium]